MKKIILSVVRQVNSSSMYICIWFKDVCLMLCSFGIQFWILRKTNENKPLKKEK